MKLYVTRHGETDFNAQGRYAGGLDVPLSENGISQARELSCRLNDMSFDAAVSSPMLRARQTADIVCGALGMKYFIYDEFAERKVGVFEGLTRDEAKAAYPELWNRRCTSQPDDAPDGGETLRQACERIAGGVIRLKNDFAGKSVLLVCHAFAARAVNRYCMNLSFDEMSGFTLDNCGVVEYALDE